MKNIFLYVIMFAVFTSCGDKRSETAADRAVRKSMFAPGKIMNSQENAFSLILLAKDTTYMIGEREAGHSVYLLNNEAGVIYKSETGKSQRYFEEVSGVQWNITPATPQPPADMRFDIAYASADPIDYNLVEKDTIRDANLIADIHRQIKLSGFIDTLLSYDDAFIADSLVGKELPTVVSIDFPGSKALIATYSYLESLSGPQMMIIDNKMYPISGPCSYEYVYPFRINNRYFIQTGSSCCECGWVIDQVYEVKGDSTILVFQDDSYSK